MLYYIILYHVILHYITLNYTISSYILFYHILFYHIILLYTMACDEQKHMFGGNTIGLYKAVRLGPMKMVRRKTGIAYNQRFEHNVSKLYDVLSKQIVLWGMPHFELIMTCLGFGDVRWDVLSLEGRM